MYFSVPSFYNLFIADRKAYLREMRLNFWKGTCYKMNTKARNRQYQCKKQKSLKERIVLELKRNWGLYLLVSIPLAYLIIFKYIPMYGVQIAFREYKPGQGFSSGEWVGLKYFMRFLTHYNFKKIMLNTISISLYSLATFPLPIILALLLNYVRNQRFKKTVQMVSYAPYFISTVVMVGMILQFLDAKTGIINILVKLLGGEAQNWMAKPEYFRHIYIWTDVWQGLGYSSIMYISALASVSPELHEAAIIDGANIRQRIWHVDLPGILPTVSIMLILRCGSILSVGYEKIYLMQNNLNLSISEIISTYVYKEGLTAAVPQYSYSTAVNLFVSVINIIMLLCVNKITKKFSGNSLL